MSLLQEIDTLVHTIEIIIETQRVECGKRTAVGTTGDGSHNTRFGHVRDVAPTAR